MTGNLQHIVCWETKDSCQSEICQSAITVWSGQAFKQTNVNPSMQIPCKVRRVYVPSFVLYQMRSCYVGLPHPGQDPPGWGEGGKERRIKAGIEKKKRSARTICFLLCFFTCLELHRLLVYRLSIGVLSQIRQRFPRL